jgi:hypothetical protein
VNSSGPPERCVGMHAKRFNDIRTARRSGVQVAYDRKVPTTNPGQPPVGGPGARVVLTKPAHTLPESHCAHVIVAIFLPMTTGPWESGWAMIEALASAALVIGAVLAYFQARKQVTAALAAVENAIAVRDSDSGWRRLDLTMRTWREFETTHDAAQQACMKNQASLRLQSSDVQVLVDVAVRGQSSEQIGRSAAIKQIAAIQLLLNRAERLSIAIEKNLIDYEMIETLGSTLLRTCWANYEPYIKHVRSPGKGNRAYDGFERLCDRLTVDYETRERVRREAAAASAEKPYGFTQRSSDN